MTLAQVQDEEQVQLAFEGIEVASSRFSLQAVSGLIKGEPLQLYDRVRVVSEAWVAAVNHLGEESSSDATRVQVLKAIESRVVDAGETCAHCGRHG